jgi:hypothetical protein
MLAGTIQDDVRPLNLPRRCKMQKLEAAGLGKGQTMFDLMRSSVVIAIMCN